MDVYLAFKHFLQYLGMEFGQELAYIIFCLELAGEPCNLYLHKIMDSPDDNKNGVHLLRVNAEVFFML